MVSLVATAEPNATPPRVRLDLATGVAGQTFTSIAVRRNGVLLREQPYAGGETALGYDYEAPFGVPLTYTAEVQSVGWGTLLNVTWSNLTGWAPVFGGTPYVSGGRIEGAVVYRTLSSAQPVRVVIPNIAQWQPGRLRFGPFEVRYDAGRVLVVPQDGSSGGVGIVVSTGAVVVTYDNNVATLEAAGSTKSTPIAANGSNFLDAVPSIGQFRIETPTTSATTSLTSGTQLDSDVAWLTHIVSPGLSMPISDAGSDDRLFLEQGSAWTKTSKALRSMHYPIGRRRPIIVTSGPRAEYEFSIDVHAPTFELRHDLDALLADQTPLLLRSPVGYDWDIPDDWYSVGDVEVKRKAPAGNYEGVTVSLPLTPVDPPVLPQGSTRTYGDLLMEAATYADLTDLYATYTDLLAGGVA